MNRDRSTPAPEAWSEAGPLAPLAGWAFSSCWVGGMIASCANWMLGLSVPFLVYEMTGSSTWLGIAAIASNGPALIASPLGGVWADRYPKRTMLMLALSLQIAVVLALHLLARADALTLPSLLGLASVMGFATAVHLSSFQAFVAEIVPAWQIAAAYRLNAIRFTVSRALGPAIAGFVLAQGGASTAFLVNALAYTPLLLVLMSLPRSAGGTATAGGALGALAEGARAAWRDPRLRAGLLTTTMIGLFGMGVQPLIAGLAKDVFGVGEQGLGLLVSAFGISSLATALATVLAGDAIRRSRMIRVGLACYATGLWIVAATDRFAVGMLGFAVAGFAHILVGVSVTTSVQTHVPGELRGRVTSLQVMSIILAMPAGAQLGGLIGDAFGLRTTLALYGGALLLYAGWAQLRMDRLHVLD